MNLKAIVYRFLGYKTTHELFTEMHTGQRKFISGREIKQAQKLEQTLYSHSGLLPRSGEIFEALEDTSITYLTYPTPYAHEERAVLPRGEKIIVSDLNSGKLPGIVCEPVNYKKLETLLIPREIRNKASYAHFSLRIETELLSKSFRKVRLR